MDICKVDTVRMADVAAIMGAAHAPVMVPVGARVVVATMRARKIRAGSLAAGRDVAAAATGAASMALARIAARVRRGACVVVAAVAALTRGAVRAAVAALMAAAGGGGCSMAVSFGSCC